MFWFPRDCPRATFWPSSATSPADLERFFDGETKRVHATEQAWLDRIRAAAVVAYRLPEDTFRPHPEVGGYWISDEAVEPIEVVPLGDLIARHAASGIELRFVRNLWPLWERVTGSTVEFGASRLVARGVRYPSMPGAGAVTAVPRRTAGGGGAPVRPRRSPWAAGG